jgi:hypothetical protein
VELFYEMAVVMLAAQAAHHLAGHLTCDPARPRR